MTLMCGERVGLIWISHEINDLLEEEDGLVLLFFCVKKTTPWLEWCERTEYELGHW